MKPLIRILLRSGAALLANALACSSLPAQTSTLDDHGNSTITATAVALPSTVTGNLERAGDVDFFKFTLTAPVQITAVSSGTTDVVGRLLLGRSRGSATDLVTDNDGAGAPNFRISQLLPAGTNYLTVYPAVYGTVGAYTLNFRVDPPCSAQPDITLGLGGANLPPGALVNFGTAAPGGIVTRDFIVGNAGDAPLRIYGVRISLSGSLPTGASFPFRILASPAPTVEPGRQTTFRIGFQTNAAGTYNGNINVVSNDGDEIFYEFPVQGTSSGPLPPPEIGVRDGKLDVPNNAVIDAGATPVNTRLNKTIALANTGIGELKITGSSLVIETPAGGTNAGSMAFSIYNSTIPSVVAPGAQATFQISLYHLVAGSYAAKLTLYNNDSDENPTVVHFTGTVTPDPVHGEIAVAVDGADQSNNGSVAFGNNVTGVGITKDFVISNPGTTALKLTSWQLSVPPPEIVPVATSTTLGSPSATVANPANLAVGMGISGPFPSGTAIAAIAGNSVTFSAAATSTITNTLLSYYTGGPSAIANAFRFDSSLPSSLVAGASATLKVTYLPMQSGNHQSVLKIFSNDADENPFALTLSGHADVNPNPCDISITLDGKDIAPDSTVDWGPVSVGNTSQKFFTIANLGGSELRFNGFQVTPVHPALSTSAPPSFLLGGTPSPVLPAGQSGMLVINFKPTTAGTAYQSTLVISSSDPDESTYRLNLTGGGATNPAPSPDIDVLVNGAPVANNGSFAFGSGNSGTVYQKPLTLFNSGAAPLTITGITVSQPVGTPAGTQQPFNVPFTSGVTLNPGTSFGTWLIFAPTIAGSYNGRVQIVTNDADENPYILNVTGTAIGTVDAPELELSLDGVDVPMNGSVAFGNTPTGTPVSKLFTIHNSGSATLNLSGFGLVQSNASTSNPFRFEGALPTSVAAGASASFTVTYAPLSAGNYAVMVRLSNNDNNENPYQFTVTGSATGTVPQPEISVTLAGVDVPRGSSVNYGSTNVGVPVTKQFVVSNNGNASLNLTGFGFFLPVNPVTTAPTSTTSGSTIATVTSAANLAPGMVVLGPFPAGTSIVSINGTSVTFSSAATSTGQNYLLSYYPTGTNTLNPFRFEGALPGSVAAGATALLNVSYAPTLAGSHSMILRFNNNDSDENPYQITLTGAATANPYVPDIAVFSGTAEQPRNSTLDFGTIARGTTATKDLAIKNTGTANLNIGSLITALTPNPAPSVPAFTVQLVSGSTTIVPGGSATLRVTFKPEALNTAYKSTYNINSNDPDENPYGFTLTGASLATDGEINVSYNGADLPPLGTISYGTDVTVGSLITKTYTISNTGTAALAITGWSILPASGTYPSTTVAPFYLANLPSTIAPGSAATVSVVYRPILPGTDNWVISMTNSDADENPYKINLTGTAIPNPTPPEVALSVDGSEIPSGGSLAVSSVVNVAVTKDILIRNTGLGELRIASYWTQNTTSTNSSAFTTTQGPPQTIATGATGVWRIKFLPTAAGSSFVAKLTLHNSDPDESAYIINLTGSTTL